MKEVHVLVDYENVQPTLEDLRTLVPELTDVWLFHGQSQTRRAKQLQAAHQRVTLVPHSGKGKNALDFHLTFYLGYVAAKHPHANLVVVANDKGYDSMLGHAKLLGFAATRVGFKADTVPATKKAAPAKKAAARKTAPATKAAQPPRKVVAKKALAKKLVAAPAAVQGMPAAKKVAAKKTPAKKVAVTRVPVQKPTVKPPVAMKAVPKAPPVPTDKVLARAKASFSKMGKNRPTKLAALLRHLKSLVGEGATLEDGSALSRRLEEAKVIRMVGDLVLYP